MNLEEDIEIIRFCGYDDGKILVSDNFPEIKQQIITWKEKAEKFDNLEESINSGRSVFMPQSDWQILIKNTEELHMKEAEIKELKTDKFLHEIEIKACEKQIEELKDELERAKTWGKSVIEKNRDEIKTLKEELEKYQKVIDKIIKIRETHLSKGFERDDYDSIRLDLCEELIEELKK